MINKEQGFSTLLAMTVIFSLCVIILVIGTLILSMNKKVHSIENIYTNTTKIENVLSEIQTDIQFLVDLQVDTFEDSRFNNFMAKYSPYDFVISDVSTGINELFMSEDFINSTIIYKLLRNDYEAIETDYGWLNKKYANNDFLQELENDFSSSDLYPFVNELPLNNIYFMDIDYLQALLEYNNIKDVESKIIDIENNLHNIKQKEDLCTILNCNVSHPVFDFIGTKTTFWKITFDMDDNFVEAIIAAIPKRNKLDEIDHYELITKNIKRKGGNL